MYSYYLGFRISSRKLPSYLDEDFLGALFNFSGVTQNPTNGLYSVGLIKNVESFYHFILNWDIWQFAPLATQSLLFNSIVELLDMRNGVKAQFNVCLSLMIYLLFQCPLFTFQKYAMRTMNGRTTLLYMLEDNSFPPQLAQVVVKILRTLMNDPKWDQSDINDMFRLVFFFGSLFFDSHTLDS